MAPCLPTPSTTYEQGTKPWNQIEKLVAHIDDMIRFGLQHLPLRYQVSRLGASYLGEVTVSSFFLESVHCEAVDSYPMYLPYLAPSTSSNARPMNSLVSQDTSDHCESSGSILLKLYFIAIEKADQNAHAIPSKPPNLSNHRSNINLMVISRLDGNTGTGQDAFHARKTLRLAQT